ncbi:DUF1003 domain-containing protein [Patescibacteria group bacterium]|nr:DUF1003 domain-containing protein [Patescibacteria group bacterium]MBU1256444.1 DUF1003 domain-containing protein [Patescibacteria group bacterium]MBU1457548.1 DUF1003 domain-containing protein [Patescibacteria group bacterium]
MAIKSIKAKANLKRNWIEKVADWLTQKFGTVLFLSINAAWFIVWLLVNLDLIPGIKPFDSFPFGLLTMIVSLEAIFLAIIVLISQNREEKITDLREEISLQIGIFSERELSKVLELMMLILKKNNIDVSQDKQLQRMLKPFDMNRVEKVLENEVNET